MLPSGTGGREQDHMLYRSLTLIVALPMSNVTCWPLTITVGVRRRGQMLRSHTSASEKRGVRKTFEGQMGCNER